MYIFLLFYLYNKCTLLSPSNAIATVLISLLNKIYYLFFPPIDVCILYIIFNLYYFLYRICKLLNKI